MCRVVACARSGVRARGGSLGMSARMAMEGTDVEIAHHVMGDDVVLRIMKGTYEVLRCSSRRCGEANV
jgi:hypothetical protein